MDEYDKKWIAKVVREIISEYELKPQLAPVLQELGERVGQGYQRTIDHASWGPGW